MTKRLDSLGIDSSCTQSRHNGSSKPLLEREPGHIRNRRTNRVSVLVRELRQPLPRRTMRIVAAAVVLLLLSFLSIALIPWLLPSIDHSARVSASLSSLWTAEGNQEYSYFGHSVSSAGDVNGDGYDDVIVGAFYYSNGEPCEGRALLYLGTPLGLSSSPSWAAESDRNYASFGWSVSCAGDVNHDGYDDVIVGACAYSSDDNWLFEGAAFLYLGSPSGLSASPSWTATGDQVGEEFGISVSSGGDVNGDGYDDVVVGADCYSDGQTGEGRAFLYLGSSSGLSDLPSWTAESDQADAGFGYAVSSAGDTNCDGYDDVVVGAPFYSNGQDYEGRAYLYLGTSSGLSTSPSWTAESDLTDANLGFSVSSTGDVDDDGFDDVIIGAPCYTNGQSKEGCAFFYIGSSSGLSSSPSWTGESDQVDSDFGDSVSSAGDVNGDGHSDVVIGARYYMNGEQGEGRAFLYLGSSSGLPSSSDWTAESDQTWALFGCSVSSAGDVNGDGRDEVIVGAPSYTSSAIDEGRAYLYGEVQIPEFKTLLIPVIGAVAIVVALRRTQAKK